MDNLEKYIRDNKKEFDQHRADKEKLWANISERLDKTSEPIPLWRSGVFKIAAAVILFVGLSLLTLIVVNGGTAEAAEGYATEELLEIDRHYQGLVFQQVKLLKDHPRLSEEDKEEFLSFMDELDEEYEQLKVEMRDNLDNERVLEAIVNNYKKRIELIEKLLQQINSSKNESEYEGYVL